MNIGHLAAICRYPIKGFHPQKLARVELLAGGGIPHDRRFAIANGQVRLALEGGNVPAWVPCQAFVRLTQNTDLPSFDVDFDEDGLALRIRSPRGDTIHVDCTDPKSVAACNLALAGWFPEGPQGSPGLVEAEGFGLWDHRDAEISIINLETVRELARAAGVELDPLRFRGNVYLEGLAAWGELSLIGRRIRIGDAELEIIRPIDRCKATSVNPSTAAVDVHVPLVLARTFGHVFCGVYARIVRAGRAAVGDGCHEVGIASDRTRFGGAVDTAPAPHEWARAAKVERRRDESPRVTSFWLRDALAHLRGPWRPGQHVRIHASPALDAAAGPAWRCYTVSDVTDDGLLRISVKREPEGRLSSHLHDAVREGDDLVLSGPFGEFTVPPDPRTPPPPLVFVSAGIGITPIAAMLRGLPRDYPAPIHIVHGARTEDELALWSEVTALASAFPSATTELYLSRASEAACARLGARPGRIDFGRLRRTWPLEGAGIYLCGPDALLHAAKSAWPHPIHYEVFISPRRAAPANAKPPAPGPFRVRFARSRVEATWREGDTLLELAERAGLALASSCRSGVCQSCRHRVTEGSVAHVADLLEDPAAGTALLCCAVPTSDVCIEG
ncbi:MOSC domain-containing protein [Pendulispora rubella]|uniref:MOSC domain-containing protein n=1 Tax=Pendulispora rubella TaxID=2741070 RepID=A0ABZ2KZT2_9BACT